MTGADAELKLQEQGGNCYLTRYSEARQEYSLTVARNGVYAHFDLTIAPSGEHNVYEIDGSEMQSKDIFSLLNYYKNTPLSHRIDGIGDFVPRDSSKLVKRQDSKLPDDITEVYRKKSKMQVSCLL